jgi:hemerythrin-like domain-containing protein
MKVTNILRSEHEVILDVLAALESISRTAAAGAGLDHLSAQQALDVLCGLGDRCHHGKEEQLFFPALAAHGLPRDVGPLAVMMGEHDQGRALLARMVDALAESKQSKFGAEPRFAIAGTAYVELMRDHIAKENGVLFPMGDGMLSETEQTALSSAFERFEHADMGAGAHERFLGIASELCSRLGIVRERSTTTTGQACCGHGTKCA